ncbi:MAG: efflux RND transporter permease subunit, partial [Fimbriimonadaceae bacterium]|nr:efflux RND transporter permease subunit [Fimbriimonadaceae bacterium]
GRGPQGVQKVVRLGDVADVQDTGAEPRTISRLNRDEAVIVTIQKSKEGNAVEISRALRQGPEALLPILEKEYNLEFVVSLDISTTIVESIFDLNFAIIFGIILVAAVVLIFLHDIRGTIIIGVAIPTCLAATLAAYWLFGFTLNNLSLLALSLSIGVLVDDAIVIIENIYRHLAMGEDPEEAAINGRSEIGLAAIAITLADAVVFFPIGVIGGVTGQFFRPLAFGYVICLLFSLLISFTVTPMLAARWYRKGEDIEHGKKGFAKWFDNGFTRLANGYANLLEKALRRRWSVFSGGFIVLIAVFLGIGGTFVKAEPGAEFASKIPQVAMIALVPVIAVMAISVLATLVSVVKKPFKPGWIVMGLVWSALLIAGPLAGYSYRNLYKQEDVFKFGFFPVSDTGRVLATIDLPTGANLDETREVTDRIEAQILEHPEVEFVVTTIGTRGGGGFAAIDQGTNFASITATLHEKQAI